MNDENLKRSTPKEARENGRKGGIQSGKSRKRKAEIRKAIQSILNNDYQVKDKSTGETQIMTGGEYLATTLFAMAIDPKNKNNIAAIKLLIDMSGDDKSPEELKKLKSEIALLDTKNKLLKSGLGDDKQAISAIEQIAKSLMGEEKEDK